jgi:hypothetical protein
LTSGSDDEARAGRRADVTQFLDRYYTNYVDAEGLKSSTTVHGI